MLLSIIIPIYNEKENISELYNRLKKAIQKDFPKFDYEIIFIDDGSTDDSYKELIKLHKSDKKIKIIQFSRNFGHHIAISAGLNFSKGDFVVMMDGDLQHKPEDIIKLYRKMQEGYDIVYGNRLNINHGYVKLITSLAFNRFLRFLIAEDIIINSTIFRIMSKQVVKNVNQLKERNRYLVGLIGWVGFKHAEQPVIYDERYKGIVKYSFSRRLQLAVNAITSFSDYPLRLASSIGLALILIACLITLYLIYNKLIYYTPIMGWTSLTVTIILIGGIQIFFLGIIGEYLGKNYTESKQRPLYIIKNKII